MKIAQYTSGSLWEQAGMLPREDCLQAVGSSRWAKAIEVWPVRGSLSLTQLTGPEQCQSLSDRLEFPIRRRAQG